MNQLVALVTSWQFLAITIFLMLLLPLIFYIASMEPPTSEHKKIKPESAKKPAQAKDEEKTLPEKEKEDE